MNRVSVMVIGAVLMFLGVISIILGVLGLSLTPLLFLEKLDNPLLAFVIKLLMLIVGIVMFYMGRMNPEQE